MHEGPCLKVLGDRIRCCRYHFNFYVLGWWWSTDERANCCCNFLFAYVRKTSAVVSDTSISVWHTRIKTRTYPCTWTRTSCLWTPTHKQVSHTKVYTTLNLPYPQHSPWHHFLLKRLSSPSHLMSIQLHNEEPFVPTVRNIQAKKHSKLALVMMRLLPNKIISCGTHRNTVVPGVFGFHTYSLLVNAIHPLFLSHYAQLAGPFPRPNLSRDLIRQITLLPYSALP